MLQPPEQEKNINVMQRYFYKEIRGNTSQLIRRLGMRVLKPDEALNPIDPKVKEKLGGLFAEFEHFLLDRINEQLKTSKYLTGESMSWVDFCYYIELSQVREMYDRDFPQHLAKLHDWYEEMSKIE